jgi:hypothetical protein
MRILLTGCTGFVGKFVLRDLLLRAKKDDVLLCLLRGKKGQTAQQRWLEFQTDSLFAGLDFSNAQVVLEALKKSGQLMYASDELKGDKEVSTLPHFSSILPFFPFLTLSPANPNSPPPNHPTPPPIWHGLRDRDIVATRGCGGSGKD